MLSSGNAALSRLLFVPVFEIGMVFGRACCEDGQELICQSVQTWRVKTCAESEWSREVDRGSHDPRGDESQESVFVRRKMGVCTVEDSRRRSSSKLVCRRWTNGQLRQRAVRRWEGQKEGRKD